MKKQFDELKLTGKLPSPSGVGMAILKLTQREDFSAEELTQTIQSDPALSGRILKLANAARSASVAPIKTVSEAAMRLGVMTVRNVALGFSLVSSHREGACPAFDYDAYWSESLVRAVAAQTLGRRLGLVAPAEGYICGLFSGIGRLGLASVHPEPYARILEAWDGGSDREMREVEREAFEIDHGEVAVAMLEDWGLPEAYGASIAAFELQDRDVKGLSEVARRLATTLRLACLVGDACLAGESAHVGHWEAMQEVREQLGMVKDQFCEFCTDVASEWEDWGKILKIPTIPAPSFVDLEAKPVPTEEQGAARRKPRLVRKRVEVPPSEVGQGKLRILAVDDDQVSLKILSLHLRRGGHDVLTASNGEEALQIALEKTPHVVVTDWMMPEMDGISLCRALRQFEFGRRLYVILLTGREDEDRVVEAFDAGVDDYVTKPFKPKVLLARVRAGLRVVQLQEQVNADQRKMQEQVAEMAVLNRKLHQASLTDALTSLPNRRHAMEDLQKAWDIGQRTGTKTSVIMIDIDHFKKVNDVHGHDAGDEVLRRTAEVFKGVTRTADTVCRLGGEEFLIICPQTPADEARTCAERVRAAVEGNRITWGDFDRNVTISLGVAEALPSHANIDDLLKAADLAVYRAKEAGRNRVLVYEAESVGV